MMGERTMMQEALFYEFSIERHVPADHLLRRSIASSICLASARTAALLQRDRSPLDRSRAHDPHADRRLSASASAPSVGCAKRST